MPGRDKRAPRAQAATQAPCGDDGNAVPVRLRADGLVAFRSDRLVLDGVSLQLGQGGALLLRGPNGAGKSTLLRVLAGLCPMQAGRLLWDGADALADRAAHAGRIGFLGHADAIKPGLTLRENLRLASLLSGRSRSPALEAFGLAPLAELPARLLSAGQRRRAALARVMLSGRPLWLLDEPSLGLDDQALQHLGAVLAAHRAGGGMVVATTHVGLPLPGAAILELDA